MTDAETFDDMKRFAMENPDRTDSAHNLSGSAKKKSNARRHDTTICEGCQCRFGIVCNRHSGSL